MDIDNDNGNALEDNRNALEDSSQETELIRQDENFDQLQLFIHKTTGALYREDYTPYKPVSLHRR